MEDSLSPSCPDSLLPMGQSRCLSLASGPQTDCSACCSTSPAPAEPKASVPCKCPAHVHFQSWAPAILSLHFLVPTLPVASQKACKLSEMPLLCWVSLQGTLTGEMPPPWHVGACCSEVKGPVYSLASPTECLLTPQRQGTETLVGQRVGRTGLLRAEPLS
jgi:hypothetical protein